MSSEVVRHWRDLPGPPQRWWGLPLARDLARDYLGTTARWRDAHGDRVASRVLQERLLDVFDPELLRRLLVEHQDALIRWERGPEVLADVMGPSVRSEGAEWQRQRRILQPAFGPKRVAAYAGLMREAAEAGLAGLEGVQDMGRLFNHITMDVILRALFGTPAGRDTAAASTAVQTLSEISFREMFWPFTLPDWLPLPGKAAKRRSLRHLRGVIAQGLASASGDTLAAQLRVARSESGEALSEVELFDQCQVTFFAGHETSATALLWWSWLLAAHPPVQQRVAAEVDAVLAGRAPHGADALPWLDASLKEAMRLYPPAAALMSRRLTRDIEVDGLHLPARLMLRFTVHTLHHDPRWWPEPEAYRPERFLPGGPAVPRGAYLPFGVGPRVCLGQHFALQEMQLVGALLLQRYRLEPVPGEAPPTARLAVTLRPAAPLRLRLTARRP